MTQQQDRVPGLGADRPTRIPAAGWRQILVRAWRESQEDNVSLMAAGVAYSAFLALFPSLIALVSLYGLVAEPAQVQQQVESFASALPSDAQNLLVDQMRTLASGSDSRLGFGLVVSLGLALWSASGGVSGLMNAVNVAYDEEETRNFFVKRGLALLLTLGTVVFFAIAIGLIAVLPPVLDAIGLGAASRLLVEVVRWSALVALVMVALALVYRIAPDRDAPKFRWVGLGAAVATVVWIAVSVAFSLYVDNFGKYGKTYGSLAGVVVLLLWLFFTAYVVLLGAEINAESEQQTARDTTRGEELPLGERDAVKADSIPS